MNLMRSMRPALRACASVALLVAIRAIWLLLVAALGLQIWILARRELELPDFALRAIERRLAASEITVRFGRAVFDPTGRLLLEQVQLFGPDETGPLVTIRAAYARLEFLPLLIGEVRVHEIRLTGLDLRLPAMLSPSGADEAIVADFDGTIRTRGSDYDIAACTFHVGDVAVAGHGGIHIPAGTGSRPGSMGLLDLVLSRYVTAGRRLIALRPQIGTLKEPLLQMTLTPSQEAGAIVEAVLLVDSSSPDAPYAVRSLRARAVFPLLGNAPVATEVTIDAGHAAWKEQVRVESLHVALTGLLAPDRFVFSPQTVRLTAGSGRALGVPFSGPAAGLTVAEWPRVRGDIMLQTCGTPVEAQTDVETSRGDGTVGLSAPLTPELLRLVTTRLGLAPDKWVKLGEPVSLRARIALSEGWKPSRVEGNFSVRHATAYDVPIDAAGGHFVYAGHGLDVTDLSLIQGDNAAHGSYAMDTVTHQYRFLLRGCLRPLDISGWFPDWWPDFWSGFDFAAAPPAADVDVAGRWGTQQESVVFCHADADQAGIRGVPFDRVGTTLFFRPGYYEVSDFKMERAGRSGRGSFTLAVDLRDSTYRTLDFDAVSDLDVAACARLYGAEGAAFADPFQFAEPPTVHLSGHFDGPAAANGPHAQLQCTVVTENSVSLHGFPLDSMKFSANYRDDDLRLQDITLGFAGGAATGQARIEGPPEKRTLAFDAKLEGANLARVITILDGLQSPGRPPGNERSGDNLLRRASSSQVDGRMAASGRLGEPFSYHGDGRLTIAGQELGEIHLLGLLSEMLSRTPLLNFTSLRLDSAQASFRIEGNKIVFPQVKLQGPRAAIEARGEYLLDGKALDFNARVFPLQESKIVVADALGILLSPLSNVLELKLTGPLEKPSWAFAFGPTNILRTITRPLNGGSPAPNGTPPTATPLTSPEKSP